MSMCNMASNWYKKNNFFQLVHVLTDYYKQKKHYLKELCQNGGSNNNNNNNNININQLQNNNQTHKPLFKIYVKDILFNKKLKFDIYKISRLTLLKCIYSQWKYSLKISMILCGRWCVYNVTKIRDDDIDYYDGERFFWDRQKTNIEKIKFL